MIDPTIAFLAGVSVGQLVSLLLVTGSIKIGEVRALKSLLIKERKPRRRPTKRRTLTRESE